VGAAATATVAAVLEAAEKRGSDVTDLLAREHERELMVAGFVDAYRGYCWPVDSVDDLRLAPFQVLAGEGKVHALSDHLWHLDVLGRLCAADSTAFRATSSVTVDLADESSERSAVAWWEELTGRGGEGMVVKPVEVVHRGPKGLTQPGIKCRGREYLRIIYGPEYTAEQHLSRLRSRGLGHKCSLATRVRARD
jgi:protein phosphatase